MVPAAPEITYIVSEAAVGPRKCPNLLLASWSVSYATKGRRGH